MFRSEEDVAQILEIPTKIRLFVGHLHSNTLAPLCGVFVSTSRSDRYTNSPVSHASPSGGEMAISDFLAYLINAKGIMTFFERSHGNGL